jgi:hypothetical protein
MDNRYSIWTHPALAPFDRALRARRFRRASASLPADKKSAYPARSFLLAGFRIVSLPHPISCGYSTTSIRSLSAPIRAASGQDAGEMRPRCGANLPFPPRPRERKTKRTEKMSQK